MKMSEVPEIVNWSVTHFVFVEKLGPFQETARSAWETVVKNLPELEKSMKVTGRMSLYKVKPQMIYRAGVVVQSKPTSLPDGFQYVNFEGGKYSKFTLTGPYRDLPETCGKVFAIVEKTKIPVADHFFIENYANDPATTPEDQLITEMLVPTK